FWIHKNIDAYAVATKAMKQALVARGVNAERVRVTGIPIDGKFALRTAKSAARSILGIDQQRTTLLLMGGGLGIGPLEKALIALDDVSFDVQMVVVVGKNERLQRR